MHDANKAYRLRDFANECLTKVYPGQLMSLASYGWTFGWCRSKRSLGWCKPDKRTIELSPYFLHEPEEKLRNTILHEIAHALAGCHNGHNEEWKRWCVIVGAKPERCSKDAKTSAEPRWFGKCVCCGYVIKYHRRPKYLNSGMYHKKCGTKGILVWSSNV